jgi:hypothetical protein
MHIKYIPINSGKLKIRMICVIVIISGFKMVLFSQSAEYTLKAVALEKISLFINWPANTLKNDPSKEFVIGVYGVNPFSKILEDVYKDKKIKDRKVKIVTILNIQSFTECHLLFIPKIKNSELNKILNYIKEKPILTISDSEGFAEAGCFINFYEYENKLRFEINQRGMEEAGFTIDYRLLRVSKVLNPVLK